MEQKEDSEVFAWRCNGACRDAGPSFGVVWRLDDRPPNSADGFSWLLHLHTCGGSFERLDTQWSETMTSEERMDWEAYLYSTSEVDSHLMDSVEKDVEKYFPLVNGEYTNPISEDVNAQMHERVLMRKRRRRPLPDCSELKFPWPAAKSGRLGGSGNDKVDQGLASSSAADLSTYPATAGLVEGTTTTVENGLEDHQEHCH